MIFTNLRRWLGAAAVISLLMVTSGCATIGYYGQSIKGHLGVMAKAEPIEELVNDARTPPALKTKLQEVLAIRAFASGYLALADNGSYRSYADIGRPYVVWNVFAAPELSLQPKQWCFLIVGCVRYRGYYSRENAEDFAAGLRTEGYDIYVSGVPAYSTLGWFDDPVLNTMLGWSDVRLAGLIFHELAHQELFIKGDTAFNESFATAVEQVGVLRWLAAEKGPQAIANYQKRLHRRSQFEELIQGTRGRLQSLYESELSDAEKRAGKQRILEQMRNRYARLKADWGGYTGYDPWFEAPLNNARFAAVSAYGQYVPAFLALLRHKGGDLEAFYEAARRLGRLEPEERQAKLERLTVEAPPLESLVGWNGRG